MKMKYTALVLAFALPFAACIKMVIPVPPPPGGSTSTSPSNPTSNGPYGISMYVDGRYSTYNTNLSVDTTQNQFSFIAWGDSAWCHNLQLTFDVNKADYSTLTTGMYVTGGYQIQNEGGFVVNVYGGWGYTNSIGFVASPDTVNIISLTDTTITGTFWGTCNGEIDNQNYPFNKYDSVMTVTDGKFYLPRN